VCSPNDCQHCRTRTHERKGYDVSNSGQVRRLSHGATHRLPEMVRPGMAAFSASRPSLEVEQP
jgi:hypothetical protein